MKKKRAPEPPAQPKEKPMTETVKASQVETEAIEIQVADERHDALIDPKGLAIVTGGATLSPGRAFKFLVEAGACPKADKGVPLLVSGRELSIYLVRTQLGAAHTEIFAQVAD